MIIKVVQQGEFRVWVYSSLFLYDSKLPCVPRRTRADLWCVDSPQSYILRGEASRILPTKWKHSRV